MKEERQSQNAITLGPHTKSFTNARAKDKMKDWNKGKLLQVEFSSHNFKMARKNRTQEAFLVQVSRKL